MNRRTLTLSVLAIAAAGVTSRTAGASPKGGGGSSAGGQLRMNTITAPVLRRSGRRGVLSVECTLDIASGALLERAKLSQPRLHAAYNEAMAREASRQLPHLPPDLPAIARALQQATDRVLGAPGATVLLGTVMVS